MTLEVGTMIISISQMREMTLGEIKQLAQDSQPGRPWALNLGRLTPKLVPLETAHLQNSHGSLGIMKPGALRWR